MTILFECIVYLLLAISIIYLFASYRILIGFLTQTDITVKNNDTEVESPENIIGKRAPNFFATSLQTGENKSLEQIVVKDTVLVFVDTECTYCNNNLEVFLNDVQNHSQINYVILIDKSQRNTANIMMDLFDGKLNIYLTEYSTFDNFRILYLPSFVLIDSKFTIKNVTPIPIFIFQNTISA